ncbi:MAG TPA: amidohydrolase family protein [Vicinamibacterales bacterium]
MTGGRPSRGCIPLLVVLMGVWLQSCSGAEDLYYTAADFTAVAKRDTHVHINTTDPSFIEQAKADNFSLITINVDVPYFPSIDEQQSIAVAHVAAFPGRVAYAATISVKNFNSPQWTDDNLRRLTDAFSSGAVAVKFWKNIGMDLRAVDGSFVMIDDPKFDPVLALIARHKSTMIGHNGEPKNCWLPLADMTTNNDRDYYKQHPEYYMYLHRDYPSYEQQIQARDRMLSRHPDLTFVGAHLGSIEWSTDELAKRLDAFPNMAVDMAARIAHLQYQARMDHDKVRRFFLRYQDRLMYGSDQAIGARRDPAAVRARAHEIWTRDWLFLTSDATLRAPEVNGAFNGLKLPRAVIDKLYRTNAERWFPGIKPRG